MTHYLLGEVSRQYLLIGKKIYQNIRGVWVLKRSYSTYGRAIKEMATLQTDKKKVVV